MATLGNYRISGGPGGASSPDGHSGRGAHGGRGGHSDRGGWHDHGSRNSPPRHSSPDSCRLSKPGTAFHSCVRHSWGNHETSECRNPGGPANQPSASRPYLSSTSQTPYRGQHIRFVSPEPKNGGQDAASALARGRGALGAVMDQSGFRIRGASGSPQASGYSKEYGLRPPPEEMTIRGQAQRDFTFQGGNVPFAAAPRRDARRALERSVEYCEYCCMNNHRKATPCKNLRRDEADGIANRVRDLISSGHSYKQARISAQEEQTSSRPDMVDRRARQLSPVGYAHHLLTSNSQHGRCLGHRATLPKRYSSGHMECKFHLALLTLK